jgi:hypothetical protein
MALHRSLDEYKLISALLHDVAKHHGAVFNYNSLQNTLKKVQSRLSSEGLGFLTKTLPKLGKAFDKALTGSTPLNASQHRFSALPGSKLPRFLGELFSRVLSQDGTVLQEPCIMSIVSIRQICTLFYKYKLPYSPELEQQVLDRFIQTEIDLDEVSALLDQYQEALRCKSVTDCRPRPMTVLEVARAARRLLSDVFAFFDPLDIDPTHGPGVVATKQRAWSKYVWTNVSDRITRRYPLDAYFFASLGHVCDRLSEFNSITSRDLPAQVILVPKDSRGPRLISCEPVDFQWIQQGLRKAIVKLVETHPRTTGHVYFTNQCVNQWAALKGSITGDYATLDLKDASDRVTTSLVHLLFPPHLCEYLDASRSSATVMPDGMVIPLQKYAPMGSALCFPIMATCIWAILTAGSPDADTRERILVYGDDVIVPTAYAAHAIELLESFGLLVNRDKSCTTGFFRESCGVDAFKGVDVTAVKLKTVWSSAPSPESYEAWLAYANAFYDRKCFHVYDYIVQLLTSLYWPIPTKDLNLSGPCLPETPENTRPPPRRINKNLQKIQVKTLMVRSPVVTASIDGWCSLLRYFAEKANSANRKADSSRLTPSFDEAEPFSVSSYTHRRTSKLVRSWR